MYLREYVDYLDLSGMKSLGKRGVVPNVFGSYFWVYFFTSTFLFALDFRLMSS